MADSLKGPSPRDDSSDEALAALIKAIGQGDESAFEALVRQNESRVRRLLVSMVSDPAEAEDLAQETFLKVLKNARKYRGSGSAKGWLFRIASRTAMDALRRRKRRAETALEPGVGWPSAPSVESQLESRQRLERVWRGMGRLSPESRLALTLREIEGMSYREMAEVLECPLGTILSRVHRARKELLGFVDEESSAGGRGLATKEVRR